MKFTRDECHEIWKTYGASPESYAKTSIARSEILVQLVKELEIFPLSSIIELGCNAGRNLEVLRVAGYENTTGLDINPSVFDQMAKSYPELHKICHKFKGFTIEEWSEKDPGFFKAKLIFTMATLMHLHPDSEWVFEKIAERCVYLITIEAETQNTANTVPRNYKDVFESLGMVQIKEQSMGDTMKHKTVEPYIARVFKHG